LAKEDKEKTKFSDIIVDWGFICELECYRRKL